MSPHTEALAPSGRSFAEHSARRSAAPNGVSPASSTSTALAPWANSAAAVERCPFTAAQCSGVRPQASRHPTIGVLVVVTPPAFPGRLPLAPPPVGLPPVTPEGNTPLEASTMKSMTLVDAPARAATCSALCLSSSVVPSAAAEVAL